MVHALEEVVPFDPVLRVPVVRPKQGVDIGRPLERTASQSVRGVDARVVHGVGRGEDQRRAAPNTEVIRLDEEPVLKTGAATIGRCGFKSHGFRCTTKHDGLIVQQEDTGVACRRSGCNSR